MPEASDAVTTTATTSDATASTAVSSTTTNTTAAVSSSRRAGVSENIQVFIRIRPLIDRETSNERLVSSGHFIRATDEKTIEVRTADTNIKCKYDQVFDPTFTQEQVYEKVKECTDSFLKGFNSTLFAYGQTGSGKSFTMFGAETDLSRYRPGLTKSQAGIIPRAIKDIFAGLVQMENDAQAMVYCSFVQIYNEHIFDLLRDSNMDKPLEIHEDRKNGIYVEGLSEYAVRNVNDCLNLLQCGEQNRAVRATHMNQVSSRSHSVFQLLLEQRKKDGTSVKSKFNLVDLAGSEKWNMDTQMMDHHISEMTNINLSLHTLGRCIAALSTTIHTHVPYRDSKLTRLLQDSLGGNTKTKIIATLSPSLDCIEESISTLKFADRAKQVMVQVRINEHREIDPAYVQKLEDEILQLRTVVRTLQSGGSVEGTTSNNESEILAGVNASASVPEGQDPDLRAQLVRLIQENNDLKHQLQQRSRQNSNGGPAIIAAAGGGIASSADLSVLQLTLKQLKDASDKFFKFEIEEEELKNIHDRLFKGTLSGGSSSTTTVGFSPAKPLGPCPGGSMSPLPSSSTTSISKPRASFSAIRSAGGQVPPKPQTVPATLEMHYRVRGRSHTLNNPSNNNNSTNTNTNISESCSSNNGIEWKCDGLSTQQQQQMEKNPEKELENARKAIQKQAKLQAWLIEKEKKELLKLQQEQDFIEEQRKQMAEKELKYQKHAAATKKKLFALQQTQTTSSTCT